ncbi:MAG: sulfatase-like hydrolase/transferase, partial [Planctomycetota bacterium]|nr:sulfatase-like hydrolase/transferase [Planctomycetota bacterium]
MRPNLLLVIVDDLRSDRLGFAGLERAETPFLDSVAARGVRFTRCFSTAGWTLPACASIVTGLHPSEHGLIHHDRRFDAPKIPALLGAGYASFGVGNNGNLVPDDIPEETLESLGFERRPRVWKRFGWQEGFETYRWFHKEDKDGPFEAFAQWLTTRGDDSRPWFAMLHTNVVHDYDMDHPWCTDVGRFLDGDLHPELRRFRDGPHIWAETPEGLDHARLAEQLVAKYDACVAEADRRLAEALEPVDLSRTVVCIASDHGEG